ncbi:uncharacterized protein LOC144000307 isoform X3 [Lithobates pipiens]
MKAIVLSALLAVLLIQVVESATTAKSLVESATTAKSPLRCHFCEMPEGCKRHKEVNCARNEDTCVKIHRPIQDPSGTENKYNYYAEYAKGIMVWGRGCSTKAKCEKEKETNMKRKLKVTVECCQKSLCNA